MRKIQFCTTISPEVMDRIDTLMRALPDKMVNGRPKRVSKADVIALYDSIVYNYCANQQELIDEFEGMLAMAK